MIKKENFAKKNDWLWRVYEADVTEMLRLAKQTLGETSWEKGGADLDKFLLSFDISSLGTSLGGLAWFRERGIVMDGYTVEDQTHLETAVKRAWTKKAFPQRT